MRDLRGMDGWNFLRLLAHQHVWSECVDFVLIRETNGPRAVCAPPQFIEIPAGDPGPIQPTFSLAYQEAQELMDALWNVGLRPTQSRSSAGQTEAVERHLADMRTIAFSKLEIVKP